MSENRRYFYLKLKDSFFDSDAVVLLEAMPDGVLYSNILLKLYLKSLKHEGRLQLGENIPYTLPMLAAITRHAPETVERALEAFSALGLVDRLTDGGYYMGDIELLIGKSSTEGERKMRQRMRLKSQNLITADICPPEIELETEPERKTERDTLPPFGAYKNVLFTKEEHELLQAEFPHDYEARVERLSEYMASSGKSYGNHLATIRAWAKADKSDNTAIDYTCGEGESL